MGQKGDQPTLASIGQEKYSIFLPKCFAKGHAKIESQRTWHYSVTTTITHQCQCERENLTPSSHQMMAQKPRPSHRFHSSSPFMDNLGDCVSNDNPSPLNLLFGEPRGDANLQCRLKLPSRVLARGIDCSRHTLEPRYQDTVCQRLRSCSVLLLARRPILV